MKSTITAVVAALVIGVTAPVATAEPNPLQQALDDLVAAGAAGLQLRLHDERGDWVGSAGGRRLDDHQPLPRNAHFRTGDVTMTFTSTVVLQLAGEHKIDLDAPVDTYLQRGIDRRVTVRMLLGHTSGLHNYKSDIPTYGQEFVDQRYRTYQPAELADKGKAVEFTPGTQWAQSHTNYVLAGMLIEKVTGTSYAKQIERRIIKPLRLGGTSLPGTSSRLPNPYLHGYLAYTHDGTRKLVDISRYNPSWAGAGGELISTTKDLDTFITALLGGQLLKPAQLAEMRAARPYGLGLVSFDFGDIYGRDCGGVLHGHDSGGLGYGTYLLSNADRSTRFVMTMTIGDTDYTNPVEGGRLFAALNKVFEVALCEQPD